MITALLSRKRSHDGDSNITSSVKATPCKNDEDCSPTSNKKSRLSIDKLSQTQHQTTLHLSSLHLSTAQSSLAASRDRLRQAKDDFSRCRNELREASEWNDVVERKWGVIDVDDGGDPPIVSAVSEESCESDEDGDEAAAVEILLDESATKHTCNNTQIETQQIHITGSGEPIVNGAYDQVFLANNDGIGSKTSPEYIYSNTSGPFLICNFYHDICLFKKEGYGDKFRWCLALVPRTNHLQTTNDPTLCQDQWDFARAYIYKGDTGVPGR